MARIEPRCRCGHDAEAHPKPRWLIGWLWGFEYLFLRRPCSGIYDKPKGKVRCTCPRYRPAVIDRRRNYIRSAEGRRFFPRGSSTSGSSAATDPDRLFVIALGPKSGGS